MFALRTAATICLFATLLPACMAQADSNERRDGPGEPIEGTWKLRVDRIPLGTTFNVFTSFAAGGVVVATGSLDRLESVSTVFGSWKRSGRNRVDLTIYFFLFDPKGNPIGTLKTNETLRLDGKNKLSGTGLSYVCDVAGDNCPAASVGAITLAGTRIEAEGVKD